MKRKNLPYYLRADSLGKFAVELLKNNGYSVTKKWKRYFSTVFFGLLLGSSCYLVGYYCGWDDRNNFGDSSSIENPIFEKNKKIIEDGEYPDPFRI